MLNEYTSTCVTTSDPQWSSADSKRCQGMHLTHNSGSLLVQTSGVDYSCSKGRITLMQSKELKVQREGRVGTLGL